MHYMKNQKVSQETKQKIKELRLRGKTYREIMQETGVKSTSHVKYLLRNFKMRKIVTYLPL